MRTNIIESCLVFDYKILNARLSRRFIGDDFDVAKYCHENILYKPLINTNLREKTQVSKFVLDSLKGSKKDQRKFLSASYSQVDSEYKLYHLLRTLNFEENQEEVLDAIIAGDIQIISNISAITSKRIAREFNTFFSKSFNCKNLALPGLKFNELFTENIKPKTFYLKIKNSHHASEVFYLFKILDYVTNTDTSMLFTLKLFNEFSIQEQNEIFPFFLPIFDRVIPKILLSNPTPKVKKELDKVLFIAHDKNSIANINKSEHLNLITYLATRARLRKYLSAYFIQSLGEIDANDMDVNLTKRIIPSLHKTDIYGVIGKSVIDRIVEIHKDTSILNLVLYQEQKYEELLKTHNKIDYTYLISNILSGKYEILNKLSDINPSLTSRLLNHILAIRSKLDISEVYNIIKYNPEITEKFEDEFLNIKCAYLYSQSYYDETIKLAQELLTRDPTNINAINFKISSIRITSPDSTLANCNAIFNNFRESLHSYEPFKIIRLILILQRWLNKTDLNSIVTETEKKITHTYYSSLNLSYMYYFLFGNVEDCVSRITQRNNPVIEVIEYNNKKVTSPSSDCYISSTKNICYQYSLSSNFNNLPDSSVVVCDYRFYDLFSYNFPNLKFHALMRPESDIPCNQYQYFFDDNVLESGKHINLLTFPSQINVNNTGWLKPINRTKGNKKRLRIGVSTGTGLVTIERSKFSYRIEDILNMCKDYDVDFYNLDYQKSKEEIEALGMIQPDFDLKKDISELTDLMVTFDLVVAIPNNIMDSCCALNINCFVFDPFERLSYWTVDDNYFLSKKIKFINDKGNISAQQNLAIEVHSFVESNNIK